MLPLSYGLEVIHFLEHHKSHGHHHRHYHYHQHHHHKAHDNIRPLHEPHLGEFPFQPRCRPLKLNFNGIYMSCQGRKQPILKNVSGTAKPGQLVAIMGPSGSGKTTLVNALSGRNKIDRGEITVNGEKLNKSHKRHMAYVLQRDLFLPNVTLRETLMFHAELGLPSSMTYEQKKERMEQFASLFKLNDSDLLNTKMGDVSKRGLSGGEMKRANIACEMLSNPSILFVDEPTTGLDSHNAYNVVEILSEVARNNRTVVMTIHQPSYKMFQMFDVVLLLCGGKVAYFGNREDVIPTLEKLGITIEAHCNLADTLLDQCFIEESRKALIEYTQSQMSLEYKDPVDDKANADEADDIKSMKDELREVVVANGNSQQIKQTEVFLKNGKATNKPLKEQGETKSGADSGRSSMFSDSSSPSLEDNSNKDKWPTTFATQLRILTKRNLKDGFLKFFGGLRWLNAIILSVVVGLLWFQIMRIEEKIPSMNSYMFFTATIWLLNSAFESLTMFSGERDIINKERASGMYRLSSYYCAKMIAELPLVMILPFVFYFITKPMVGSLTITTFFAHAGILTIQVLVSQSLGFFISTLIHNPHNVQVGIVACSLYSLPSILFGGFFVSNMPSWLFLFQLLSPVFHTYRAMQIVEFFYGKSITCAEENSLYRICRSGNAIVIPPRDIVDVGNALWALWTHIFVLFMINIVFRLLGYLSLRFLKSPTRTV